MATIIWKGFEKEPTGNLDVSYELITGQNLKPSSKKQSKKQPGKPIEVFFHQRQSESKKPDEIDEKTALEIIDERDSRIRKLESAILTIAEADENSNGGFSPRELAKLAVISFNIKCGWNYLKME